MDKYYLEDLVTRLEKAMDEHDCKFSDNPSHAHCRARFTRAIDELRTQLCAHQTDDAGKPDVTAKGDEFEAASYMDKLASMVEERSDPEAACWLRKQARTAVLKQLNELDGFDR